MADLKNKDITREIIKSAAIKKTNTSRLVVHKVELMMQVKKQSREYVIQLKGKSEAGVHTMTNNIIKSYFKDKRSVSYPRNGNSDARDKCGRCGMKPHSPQEQFPAWDQVCFKC